MLILFSCFLALSNVFSQKIKIGNRMPNFELMDQHGEYFNSSDYIGKQPMIIFFYTKDESEISTREVVAFNKQIEKIKKLNAVVVGINPASIVYHRRFVIKLELKYPILFDRNNDIQKKFEVPNVKKTKNPQQYTFVIDKKGFIQLILHNDTNAEIHVIESIKALEALNN